MILCRRPDKFESRTWPVDINLRANFNIHVFDIEIYSSFTKCISHDSVAGTNTVLPNITESILLYFPKIISLLSD